MMNELKFLADRCSCTMRNDFSPLNLQSHGMKNKPVDCTPFEHTGRRLKSTDSRFQCDFESKIK